MGFFNKWEGQLKKTSGLIKVIDGVNSGTEVGKLTNNGGLIKKERWPDLGFWWENTAKKVGKLSYNSSDPHPVWWVSGKMLKIRAFKG